MPSYRRPLVHPLGAAALTAAMLLTLPSCQGRRRAHSPRSRQAEQHEYAISIAGDAGIRFSGSYRIIRSDGNTLQPLDGLTPALIRLRGPVVSAEIRKVWARGRLEVRILREGCNPSLGPCVEVDGVPYRTVARSSTVEPYGMVLVSSAATVVPRDPPGP